MKRTLVLPLVLTVLGIVQAASAAVIYVGQSLPLNEIYKGIAAAAPGDTIFVNPGSYAPFTVDKAVKIHPNPAYGTSYTVQLHQSKPSITVMFSLPSPPPQVRPVRGNVP